jgi:isoleucyl-tRNA synthetase
MKLKDTLCLPRTEFPMKGSLPQREPERIAAWERADIQGSLRRERRDAPKYVLHDGPPYANGHLHLGTALNKILKDFVLRSRCQAGFDVPYVPGWDCHGMPIEFNVLKAARDKGERPEPAEIRARCRAYAEEYVGIQRTEFQRLGVGGAWADPYMTMAPSYQATIVSTFGRLWREGHVYKGLRPIHWCPTCVTALANAEVEHDPKHESIAIHVRFALAPDGASKAAGLPDDAAFLAWTTTPWTIPANVALAVRPDLDYALVGGDGRHAILLASLLPGVAKELRWADAPVVRTWKGSEIQGLRARHPLLPRDSQVVTADYVTTDTGTGVVHTAPGHGVEDFETGRRHGLPTIIPVTKEGVFTKDAGPYEGQHVFKANARIADDLEAAGALAGPGRTVHSYPTCWRCHGPLIFLATEQWFWNVDHRDLRRRALDEVEATQWLPAWGHDRMRDSVTTRPDWCLSRQRSWGVPIPSLQCRACGKPVLDEGILEKAASLVGEGGVEAWIDAPIASVAGADRACEGCGSRDLEKDPYILDVWFDSSCSHEAVLRSGRWPDMSWPADLYIEAVDQHRGWFQVSLLNSVALHGRAPFRAVFTHGLILDEKGRKMSKSLGNVVSPEEIIKTQGADVLRLFFASVDPSSDIRFSKGLLEPVSEAYRKIRNTLRFLLGNVSDFDPGRDAVPEERLLPLDRRALERLREVSAEARQAWDELDFHRVQRTVHGYLVSDVSAFYAHVTKDRLYCDLPTGARRRSAQQVLFEIARETCQLLAPILCFTADEAWEHLPAWEGKPASVHLATWPALPERPDPAGAEAWRRVIGVRETALKQLEIVRASGAIGDPLEASVVVGTPDPKLREELQALLADLPEMFVVSAVSLTEGAAPEGATSSEAGAPHWVHASRAGGTKCPRCWTWRSDAPGLPAAPDACARCAEVLTTIGAEIDPA